MIQTFINPKMLMRIIAYDSNFHKSVDEKIINL